MAIPASQSIPFDLRKQQRSPGAGPLGFSTWNPRLSENEQLSDMDSEAGKQEKTTHLEDRTEHDNSGMAVHHPPVSGFKVSSTTAKVLSFATDKNLAKPGYGATLVWRDLTVTIQGKRKYSQKVVNTSTGYALPQSLTGIMGPSRCGKSTLLRALAGVLPEHAKVYGEILINGRSGQLKYGSFAYINKGDELIETLTVWEALHYSALLQLPDHIPGSQKAVVVNEIMKIMELEDLAEFYIGGGCYRKGLSPGEKRRLSIATQLLTKPSIVFIDEPIHCLDSVSAIVMMVTLKRFTRTGCTVIVTIQNSCAEVFSLLDRICLIANGKTIFFGETLACLEHFSNAGFPCPLLQNPSDHFLRALDSDFDKILKLGENGQDSDQGDLASPTLNTTLIMQTLEAVFKGSNDATFVESLVIQLSEKEGPRLNSKHHAKVLTQLAVLTWRSFLNMSRDWEYFWLRLFLSISLMLCLGTVYLGLKHSFSMQAQESGIFYMISFICLMGIGGFPALIKELKVHAKESSSGHIGTVVFLLGNLLSSLPFLFLISSSCSAIGYFLLGLHPAFSFFMYFVVDFFLCLLVTEGLMMLIAFVLPRIFEGILTVVAIQGVMMLVSGYFRQLDELPKPIWKYPASYTSFYTYAYEGLLQNEYPDMLYSTEETKAPSNSGDSLSISSLLTGKWYNLLVLAFMAVVYRIFIFILIELGQKLGTKPLRHKVSRR